MKLNFYYYSGKVVATFYQKGQTKRIYVAACKTWDKARQRSGDPQIDKKLSEIETNFHHYISKAIEPSFKDCKALVKGTPPKASSGTLPELMRHFLADKKNLVQKSTIAKYQSALTQIERFEELRGRRAYLTEINKDFLLEFVDYLLNEEDNVNKTILRKIKTIKTVMQYGLEEGVIEHSRWDRRIDLKDVRTSRYPLTEVERQALWNFKTTNLLERRVVDAFIFSMYTGLRFEDLSKISSHHIFRDVIEGSEVAYINMTASKTVTESTIPVLEIVEPILASYASNNGPIFSLTWNSECNEVLKRVAKSIGFNRLLEKTTIKGSEVITQKKFLHEIISFHFARYTYTEIMSRSGLQVGYIQRNLNHAKLETTNAYMRGDINDRIIETRKKIKNI